MKTLRAILIVTLVMTVTLSVSAAGRGGFARSLSADAKDILITALAGPEGEYAAHAQYTAVIAKFGEVQPYVAIRAAEARHIAALERQFAKYGIEIPTNKFEGKMKAPETLMDAAKEGIAGEERNVALYDQALKKLEKYPDLVRVFTNLRHASREMHLPAFKAALESEGKVDRELSARCCSTRPVLQRRLEKLQRPRFER
jgi:hypothetical protein